MMPKTEAWLIDIIASVMFGMYGVVVWFLGLVSLDITGVEVGAVFVWITVALSVPLVILQRRKDKRHRLWLDRQTPLSKDPYR